MAHYQYQKLDLTKNEIRVLRFLEPDHHEPDLVRCMLHHVSLDDLRPEYHDFLLEMGEASPDIAEKWLDAYPFHSRLTDDERSRPRIAAWRHGSCSSHPEHPHSIFVEFPKAASRTPITIEEFHNERTIFVPPRFAWGDFEAISYCWESEVRETDVIVDDTVVQVPKNLGALLQYLQHLPEARSGMRFWIDGLCINQTDVREKNHQVGLMKRIYSRALSVITWLGPGYSESDLALEYMCGMSIGKDFGPYLHEGSAWAAILGVWSRNYFARMWIIQELALNRSLSLFMCGKWQVPRTSIEHTCNEAMDWARLIADRIVGFEYPASYPLIADQASIWDIAYNVSRICSLQPSDIVEKKLDLARRAKAKDPRDKIYGLLGLLPGYLADFMEPDYSKSIDQVYMEFAIQMLRASCSLDEILSWCRYAGSCGLPSWVPDWNQPFVRHHLQWFRNRRASGEKISSWSLSAGGQELSCIGCQVDVISIGSLSSPKHPSNGVEVPLPPQKYTRKGTFGRYHNNHDLQAAMHRTLLHDHPKKKPRMSLTDMSWVDFSRWTRHEIVPHAWENWKKVASFVETNAHLPIFGLPLRDLFTPDTYSSKDHLDLTVGPNGYPKPISSDDCYHDNLQLFAVGMKGRKLITTHTGWLGLAPEEAEIGDTIAILFGCNYPVTLRPYGGSFKYIGECYIDGLMDGEAIDASSREGYEEEMITLV
jgi:hypothetical protein